MRGSIWNKSRCYLPIMTDKDNATIIKELTNSFLKFEREEFVAFGIHGGGNYVIKLRFLAYGVTNRLDETSVGYSFSDGWLPVFDSNTQECDYEAGDYWYRRALRDMYTLLVAITETNPWV